MAKGLNVTVDVNQALDQAERLADRLWQGFAGKATNVVIALANNTQWDLRHMGGFQWQGITTDPAEDIAAGDTGGWRVDSTGVDGSFSMQSWQMRWPSGAPSSLFLNVGGLVYATRRQPRFTTLLSPENLLGDGSGSAKTQALRQLDQGRATGWTQDVSFPGPESRGSTSFEIRTVVTGPSIDDISYGMTYLVTLNQVTD